MIGLLLVLGFIGVLQLIMLSQLATIYHYLIVVIDMLEEKSNAR